MIEIIESRSLLLQKIPKNIILAELGVFKGEFSEEIKKCSDFETHEFVEQYQSVKGNYLGIGLAIKK